MAGVTGQFADALNRKYTNLESATDSENALRAAQAQTMTGALGSENALRNAQAFQTTEAGKTLAPTAAASIASTYAGIPGQQAHAGLENAQAGYYGAEADQTRANIGPATDAEWTAYWSGRNTLGNYGLGSNTTTGILPQQANEHSVTDPYGVPSPKPPAANPGIFSPQWWGVGGSPGADPNQLVQSNAGGTDDVQPLEYDPMNSYAGGTSKVAPQAPQAAMGTGPTAVMGAAGPMGAGGQPMPGMDFHTVMAHAMHALASSHPSASNPMHAAGGTTNVPTPATGGPPATGQTQTSGQWGAGGQNQGLREQMGMGKPVVKAAEGKTKVPGKGPGNVDSVPSVLAPGEAVLNSGAAEHMGRGAIAALNAFGAAKMAASGAPPAAPPSAGGMPSPAAAAPAMGAPPMPPMGGGGAPPPNAPPANSKQPNKGKPSMPAKAAPGKTPDKGNKAPPPKVAPKAGKK